MTMIKRLAPREFARAMKLGLGRTLLHVAEYGDEGVEEIIKEAMLKSFAYDVMFEGLRAWWLRDIITLTGRTKLYGRFLYDNFNQDGLDWSAVQSRSNIFRVGHARVRPPFACRYKSFSITLACRKLWLSTCHGRRPNWIGDNCWAVRKIPRSVR